MHHVIRHFQLHWEFDLGLMQHISYYFQLHLGIWFKGLVHDFSFEMVFLCRTGLTALCRLRSLQYDSVLYVLHFSVI